MTIFGVVEKFSDPDLQRDKDICKDCLADLVDKGFTSFTLVAVNEAGETIRAHHLARDLLRLLGGLQYEQYTVSRVIEAEYTDRALSED